MRRNAFWRCAAASASAKPATAKKEKLTDVGANVDAAAISDQPLTMKPLVFQTRWRYIPFFGSYFMHKDFLIAERDRVSTKFRTFIHPESKVKVTLIPLIHEAHPMFYKQVDQICCQHESVLMEGRTPNAGAPYSTLVPPRKMIGQIRPEGHEDDEGWEPATSEGFWQPFSWGVIDSPHHTVIHAADAYDYEKLPVWMTVRYNLPIIGNYRRDLHCLSMIQPLVENGYKSFAIPWGSAHMAIMATVLIRNGFEERAQGQLLAFNAVDGIHSASWCRKLLWVHNWMSMVDFTLMMIFCAFVCFVTALWFNSDITYHVNLNTLLRDAESRKRVVEQQHRDMLTNLTPEQLYRLQRAGQLPAELRHH